MKKKNSNTQDLKDKKSKVQLNVAAGTTSTIKIKAIEKVFEEHWPNGSISVQGFDAPSGINSQPVGAEETMQGAENRLTNLKVKIIDSNQQFDYLIAIENGISVLNDKWFDFAWIVLEKSDGKQRWGMSPTISIPTKIVEDTKKEGFDKFTIGDSLSEWGKKNGTQIDTKDPHFYLLNFTKHRQDLIEIPLSIALEQINHPTF